MISCSFVHKTSEQREKSAPCLTCGSTAVSLSDSESFMQSIFFLSLHPFLDHPSIFHASLHTVTLLYSLVLVLGALEVCMVLLDGVEDHTADAAGVTAAQP